MATRFKNKNNFHNHDPRPVPVKRLYCKRPIICLASSKILISPTPLTARRLCTAFGAGGGHTRYGVEGGGGSIFWKTRDTALYSTYVSTLCYYLIFAMFPVPLISHWLLRYYVGRRRQNSSTSFLLPLSTFPNSLRLLSPVYSPFFSKNLC